MQLTHAIIKSVVIIKLFLFDEIKTDHQTN